MDTIRQYLISITAVAIVCCVVPMLFPKDSPHAGILQLLCGLAFTVALVSPWREFSFPDYEMQWNAIIRDGQAAADAGVAVYNDRVAAVIKTDTEAYILDKARACDLDVQIQVEYSNSTPPQPEIVLIFGAASPLQRARLSEELVSALGLPKENILWQQRR